VKPKRFFWLLATLLPTIPLLVEAKQAEKVAKIGWLTSGSQIGTDLRSEFLRRELTNLAISRAKISRSSFDPARVNLTGFLAWRMTWCVSKLT